jgi:hypothetical protein
VHIESPMRASACMLQLSAASESLPCNACSLVICGTIGTSRLRPVASSHTLMHAFNAIVSAV